MRPAIPDIPFDTAASRAAWDRAAGPWADFVESGLDYYRTTFHGPALLDACGRVEGLRVLDLGCAQGYFSRLLAGSGAEVIGVDISERQVARALAIEEASRSGAEFAAMDAADAASRWPVGHFDLATACVSFQDLAEAEAVTRATAAVLKTGGRLVFSIPHPASCTPYREWERDETGIKGALKIDRYFDSGPRLLRWNMPRLREHWETPYWSRTIEEWSEILLAAGFLIRRLREPRPSAQAVVEVPDLEDSLRLPSFLIFDAIKSGVPPGPA